MNQWNNPLIPKRSFGLHYDKELIATNTVEHLGSCRMALDTFGKRIRALRQDRGLSQIELREKMEKEAGVSIGETYISELERRPITPSLEIAAAMAKVLDVTLDYLGMLIEDGELSYKRVDTTPHYFSAEADEVAQLVDVMRPEQRVILAAVARTLSAPPTDKHRRLADAIDVLDSIERDLGKETRDDVERIMRRKGFFGGNNPPSGDDDNS